MGELTLPKLQGITLTPDDARKPCHYRGCAARAAWVVQILTTSEEAPWPVDTARDYLCWLHAFDLVQAVAQDNDDPTDGGGRGPQA